MFQGGTLAVTVEHQALDLAELSAAASDAA
jgi:hypothetical protein